MQIGDGEGGTGRCFVDLKFGINCDFVYWIGFAIGLRSCNVDMNEN